jgi:hypothetical protein
VKKYLGQFLTPIATRVASARKASQIISRNPRQGLRLLVDAQTTARSESQPDVYPFAAYLAERFGCTHVIAIDGPTAANLIQLHPRFEIIGIVPSAEVERYSHQYGVGSWLAESSDLAGAIKLSDELLQRSLIICKNLERFSAPTSLLKSLKVWLKHAPVCILTSADRDLNPDNSNGSTNPVNHRGKWNLLELEHLLRAEGFNPEFIGWTVSDNADYEKKTMLAVLTSNPVGKQRDEVAPSDFRVVAFMAAYNEEDIIVQSIKKWTDQGVSVRVLENWSTDSTYELAKSLEGQLPVTVERFPQAGPSAYFDWGAMLQRIEALSKQIEADWFVRRGADEVLVSPWPGVSYKDALYLVDQAGFNCVDHTIVEFHPVDDEFQTGMDHEAYFRHFDLKNLSHQRQRKAWKNSGQSISTVASAGHDVRFDGRRVYPFRFLLKHYSFRSQRHGERKVFRERKTRWNPIERAKGWHVHYDSIDAGHKFVQSASEKEVFDEEPFNKTYLVERLSGLGARRKTSA